MVTFLALAQSTVKRGHHCRQLHENKVDQEYQAWFCQNGRHFSFKTEVYYDKVLHVGSCTILSNISTLYYIMECVYIYIYTENVCTCVYIYIYMS